MLNPLLGATIAPSRKVESSSAPDWLQQESTDASEELTRICAVVAGALKSNAVPDAATEMACLAEYYRSLVAMGRPELRVSAIGKHPLLNALSMIGLKTSTPSDEEWITRAGHSYEWWVKAKLIGAQKAGVIPGDWVINVLPQTIYWEGLTGNPDLVVIVPQGADGCDRPISVTFDCKHISAMYLQSVLKPKIITNPATGLPNKVQGAFEPEFHPSAIGKDTRGYIKQSAIYGLSNGGKAALLCFDKAGNSTYVVPVPEAMQARAIDEAILTLNDLRRFEKTVRNFDFSEALSVALSMFPAPPLVPQIAKGKETGYYFKPAIFSYCPEFTTDFVYDVNPYSDGSNPKLRYAPIDAATPDEIAAEVPVVWTLAS